MIKKYILYLLLIISCSCYSQVSNYLFSQSNGTYTEITGTAIWTASSSSTYDTAQSNVTIPFPFNFNGTNFTVINVNSNGSLIFPGATATTTTTTPISSTTQYAGAIAAWGKDTSLHYNSNTPTLVSNVSYGTVGTAPNREFVIQYKNVRTHWSSSANAYMNFQIRLSETTNVVKIVYGSHTALSTTTYNSGTVQVGLRGTTNADFNNRMNTTSQSFDSSTLGTSNSSVQNYNVNPTSVSKMPTNGLTYIYTPPVPCSGSPSGGTVTVASQVVCANTVPKVISIINPNPGISGVTYQWEESDDNGVADAWANVTGGTGATTLDYIPPTFTGTTDKYYRLRITCTNSTQIAYSTVHKISTTGIVIPVSNLVSADVYDNGLTFNWTNGGGTGRAVLYSANGTYGTLPTTGGALVNGTALTGGGFILTSFNDATSSVSLSGTNCNTFYFRVVEYVRCGTAPNYTYTYSAPVDITIVSPSFQTPSQSVPYITNFTGYNSSNIATILPHWEERRFNTTNSLIFRQDSEWEAADWLTIPTARMNFWTSGDPEWLITASVKATVPSQLRFKAALTDYYDTTAPSSGSMTGTDDKLEILITDATCSSGTWVKLHEFNSTTIGNLSNILTDYTFQIPSTFLNKDIRIAFKATEGNDSNVDYDFHIGNVVVEEIPAPTIDTITQVKILCNGLSTGSATAIVKDGAAPLVYSWSPIGGSASTASNLPAGTYVVTVTDALNRSDSETVTITQPDLIQGNGVVTSVTCNGTGNGSVTLSTTGGVLPYTYLWEDGSTLNTRTNLAAGTYSVVIEDGNLCQVTETFVITEPAILAVTSSSQTNATLYNAADGTATVVVSGGTAPYTYSWSPSGGTSATATGLLAGNYTVTITDANGCFVTQDFTITQPIPLMLNPSSKTDATCNGKADGTATVNPFGGNAPYTYLWSNGQTTQTATGLAAGTYTVVVTDYTLNTIVDTVIVGEPTVLGVTSDVITNITCFGLNNGAITILVTGGTAPYTYKWSNGANTAGVSSLLAGTYSVEVTDANGCKVSNSFTVTQPSALTVAIGTLQNVSCNGSANGSVTMNVTGGTAPYTYSWTTGQSGTSLSGLSGGSYTFTATDANNCTVTQTVTVTEPAVVHPPAIFTQNLCSGQNATLSSIPNTAQNIKWYSAAVGGVLLPGTTPVVSGTTYYASETINGCESTYRTSVLVNITNITPITTTSLTICGNTMIGNVVLDGFSFTQLKWYSSATAAITLSNSDVLTNGIYYVSKYINGCESTRVAVQVTAQAVVPSPVVPTSQSVCAGSTIADLAVTNIPGATVNWYTTPQSTMVLAPSTVLLNGTYYVDQMVGSCKSQRVAVQVQVSNVYAPTISNLNLCDEATVANLYLPNQNANYVWYANATTTTELASTYKFMTGTYYVAEKMGSCTSPRAAVQVVVNARPSGPLGAQKQTFGFAAQVSDLKMVQPNVMWFESFDEAMSGSNALLPSTQLLNGKMYYGSTLGSNSCTSIPTAVEVVIDLSTNNLDLVNLKYYPNPVSTVLNVEYTEAITQVEIYSLLGQRVMVKSFDGTVQNIALDLSHLSNATYVVKIITPTGSQFVKVVKK